ncbi:gamma-glutamyl-gamma-aminobutyrate hydrolase family protein [Haliangium ochraceum]|uniref:Peptidase C26 n=1 Tax=Haliangium ochraceum (strain DSM 14365 / JCM 11303 / SMP-2) TaxID=502025 RepID=D0LTG0_HALO1|nr:gamma-glutamyl-gamma-aminobutyrate hydrolase family protein [Haliangium ochraceum]ACY13855.1 peptidase C26 [Haliangium ochraceum DSM 14365]
MSRPNILVTTVSTQLNVQLASQQQVTLLNETILERVTEQGCTPLMLPNLVEPEQIDAVIGVVDGLLLTTGQDLDPASYGAAPSVEYSATAKGFGTPFRRPLLLKPNPRRDALEIALYRAAKERGLPILGLCRGMQIINAAEGGTLHQEMPDSAWLQHEIDSDGWINYHSIRLVKDSLCARIMEVEEYFVSSIHHQAVDTLGAELRVSATAEDGCIEMLEHRDPARFIVGVQGHIEKVNQNLERFRRLWQVFAERAHRRV